MQPTLQPGASQSVILKPVDPLTYVRDASAREPQYVTSIQPVQSKVFVSSLNAEQTSSTSYNVLPRQNLGTGFRRIRLVSCDFTWVTENVNSENNTFSVEFMGGAEYDFDIPEANYTTTLAIVAAFNAAFAAQGSPNGIIASDTVIPGSITITAGITFSVIPECAFYLYGIPMWGVTSELLIKKSVHTFGPIGFASTHWIDIVSSELLKNQKMRSVSTGDQSNILCRIPIDKPAIGDRIRYVPETYLAFARNATEPLYGFDIYFADQYGFDLPTRGNRLFSWNLVLELEV